MKLNILLIIAVASCGPLFAELPEEVQEHRYLRFSEWIQLGPYRTVIKGMTTIGQMTRLSEAVVEAEVLNVKSDSKYKAYINANGWYPPEFRFEIRVHSVILGSESLRGKRILVEVPWRKQPPDAEFEGIMFLTRSPINAVSTGSGIMNRYRTIDDIPANEKGVYRFDHWVLIGGTRGALSGNKKEMRAIRDYIRANYRFYWTQEMNMVEFANELSGMQQSPYNRLRDDARRDILRLYRFLEPDDRSMVIESPDVAREIRERFSQLDEDFFPEVRSRQEIEKVFEENDFYDLVASDDVPSVRAGLDLLDSLHRYERVINRDLWAHLVRPLLESNDPYVRWRAAVNLHQINDRDALRVLFDTIQELDTRYYDRLSNDLQKMTGQDMYLESDAPKQVQKNQLQEWKDWWEQREEELKRRQDEGDVLIHIQ